MAKRIARELVGVALVAAMACGRVGYDGVAAGADAGAGDIGESVTLPDGWTATVWFDFSDLYTYDDALYFDDPFTYTNRPHRLFVIPSPFEPGLGLVSSWELIEVRAPDTFVRHDYYLASTNGPEVLWDAEFCGLSGGAAADGICVAAGSQGGGDGIYRVEQDWSMAIVDPANNMTELAYDASGAFGGVGSPQLFVGSPEGVRVLGDAVFFGGLVNGGFLDLGRDGSLFASIGDPLRELVRITSTTESQSLLTVDVADGNPVAIQNDGTIAIVTGGGDQFGGLAHIVVSGKELRRVGDTGAFAAIARTEGDWIWSHAVVPPSSHPLAGAAGAFYILEVNPTTEVNRILRIGPS